MTAEQIEVIKKIGLAKSSSELEILFPEFDKAFKCEPFIEPKKEVEINGQKVFFDYCVDSNKISLEDSIIFFDNAVYIGSGTKCWYNGNFNEWKNLYYFFVKK